MVVAGRDNDPAQLFARLLDAGCRAWRVWETRAAILLLAGYSVRSVAYAAAGALRRRNHHDAACALLGRWVGEKVLRNWRRAIRESGVGPNDAAFIQRLIVERDAVLARSDRKKLTKARFLGVGRGAAPVHVLDRGTPKVGSARGVGGKRVRFAI